MQGKDTTSPAEAVLTKEDAASSTPMAAKAGTTWESNVLDSIIYSTYEDVVSPAGSMQTP
jgi:hypothetical protein